MGRGGPACIFLLVHLQRGLPGRELPASYAAVSEAAAISGTSSASRCVCSCKSFWLRRGAEEGVRRAREPGGPGVPHSLPVRPTQPTSPTEGFVLPPRCSRLAFAPALPCPSPPPPPAGLYILREGGASEPGTKGLTGGFWRGRGSWAEPLAETTPAKKMSAGEDHQFCSGRPPPRPGGKGRPGPRAPPLRR